MVDSSETGLLTNNGSPPSRSTTPTQSNTQNIQNQNQKAASASSSSMRQRPSINNLFAQQDSHSIHYSSPEQPYLQVQPPSLSSRLTKRSSNGSSSSGGSYNKRDRKDGGGSGSQSRQGSGSDHLSTSPGPTSTVSWLSLALFSDDTDDDQDEESTSNGGRKGRRRRSPTPDLLSDQDQRSESSESAIDSSTETSSNSSISTNASSFQPHGFHRDLYSNPSSSRSRSSSKEDPRVENNGDGQSLNRKTRRSVSMMYASSDDDRTRFTSNLYSRPQSGTNHQVPSSSSPLQPSVELSRNASFSTTSPSSRNKPLFKTRHGHSRSSSSSDSYNINIPSSFPSSTRTSHELNPPTSPRWSTHARRLSSSLSKSASPYLKAGLDELRDIFDVESERDGWREKEWERERDKKLEEEINRNSILPLATSREAGLVPTSPDEILSSGGGLGLRIKGRDKSRPSTAPTALIPNQQPNSHVNSIIPTASSPNLTSSLSLARGLDSTSLSRSNSHNTGTRTGNGLLSPPSRSNSSNRQPRERQSSAPSNLEDRSLSPPSSPSKSKLSTLVSSTSHSHQPFTERLVHPGSATMSRNNSESREVGSGQISPSLMLNIEGESNEKEIQTISTAIDVMARRRIGLGLVLVGFGVLGIETFEYVRDPNAISPHLIAFFSIQSLFSFIGFISLLAYKLPIMDLASRGIRAHVLAQACVALMALKELASTARYETLEFDKQDIISDSLLSASRPTSSMKFGKLFQSAQDKAQDVILSAYHHQSHPGSMQVRSYTESESASHAHETSVGNFSSQVTYLIVFLVQAAIPIMILMVLQYMVGRKLANLVRESRENLRELERRRNRTLKSRRSLMMEKSNSDSSFKNVNSNDSKMRRGGSQRVDSSSSTSKSQVKAIPPSKITSTDISSPSLNAKDLSERLEEAQDSPRRQPFTFTASPSTLSPEESSTSVPTLKSNP